MYRLRLHLMFACLITTTIGSVRGQEPKPPQLTPEEQKLAAEAEKLDRELVQLYQRGQAARAIVKAREALEIRRKLYPDGHPDLAFSLNDLGTVLQAMGSYENAVPLFEQALAMRHKLYPASNYPDGHPELASSINNLGSLLQAMGLYEKALPHVEQALAMFRKLYPASK